MKGAGYYGDRLIWMKQTEAASGDAGAVAETFTDQSTLWCAKEQPSGAEKIQWSALQSLVTYRVRMRGTFGIRSVDRFRDPDTDTVYLINGLHIEDDDEVCFATEFVEGAP